MPTIFYTEPSADYSYSLVVTDEEANTISTADPRAVQQIILPETGTQIDFDASGMATMVIPPEINRY